MSTPNETPPPSDTHGFRPRFTLRHLLQATTAIAFLLALGSFAPGWGLLLALRAVDTVLLGSLIAGAFVFTGRGRIACVAGLAALWIQGIGSSVFAWNASRFAFDLQRVDRALILAVSFASHWAEIAFSAATAYWVAGWLTRRNELSSSEEG